MLINETLSSQHFHNFVVLFVLLFIVICHDLNGIFEQKFVHQIFKLHSRFIFAHSRVNLKAISWVARKVEINFSHSYATLYDKILINASGVLLTKKRAEQIFIDKKINPRIKCAKVLSNMFSSIAFTLRREVQHLKLKFFYEIASF